MQPKRLLQAASLLLLSAAVLAQVELQAAMPSMAALPAEVQPSAVNCWKNFGAACRWGDACAEQVENCQLCEAGRCAYCKAGYFLDTADNTCTECPEGGFCGGKSTDPTLPDSKWLCEFPAFTDGRGKWSPLQCDTCFVGYGHGHDAHKCEACGAGTAKNLVGMKECDYCLDGFIANANKGATDCLNVGTGRRRLMQPSADPDAADRACADNLETDSDEFALYIADENSCGCPPWTVLQTAKVEYDEDKEWTVVPPRCITTCDDDKLVFSITGEPEPGLTECKKCPTNSKAAQNKRSCVCDDGFVPKPDFENDGCKKAPASSSDSGDDDEEWGHWSHKGGNKHAQTEGYYPEEESSGERK